MAFDETEECEAMEAPESWDAETDSLSNFLRAQWVDFRDKRQARSQKFYDNYQDRERIVRAGDTKGSLVAKTDRYNKIFIGSTRNKIRTFRARTRKSHKSFGKYPYDLRSRTRDAFGRQVHCWKKILDWQLDEMGWTPGMAESINGLGTYGTTIRMGPFPYTKTLNKTVDAKEGPDGEILIKKSQASFKLPKFIPINIIDYFHDPYASNEQNGRGGYYRDVVQPEDIQDWLDDPTYKKSAVQWAIDVGHGVEESIGTDFVKSLRDSDYNFTGDGRLVKLVYLGKVEKKLLKDWMGKELSKKYEWDKMPRRCEAVVTMAGGVVVKARPNTFTDGKRPVQRGVYENVEGEFYGVGLADNNQSNQIVLNAGARLFFQSKTMAMLLAKIVQRGKFRPGEDFIMSPDKTLEVNDNLSPEEVEAAFKQLKFEDVSSGWLEMIAFSEKQADDDTGYDKYTQGQGEADHLNQTATGMKLIMGAGSIPLEEVLTNIDEQLIVPEITKLIHWNIENLDAETVRFVFDDETAEIWETIKKVGDPSAYLTWVATGAQEFLAKERLFAKMMGMLQIVAGNETLAPYAKWGEFLSELWKFADIDRVEAPFYTDEEVAAQLEKQAQQMEKMRMQQASEKAAELETKYQIAADKIESKDRNADADRQQSLAEAAITSVGQATIGE